MKDDVGRSEGVDNCFRMRAGFILGFNGNGEEMLGMGAFGVGYGVGAAAFGRVSRAGE